MKLNKLVFTFSFCLFINFLPNISADVIEPATLPSCPKDSDSQKISDKGNGSPKSDKGNGKEGPSRADICVLENIASPDDCHALNSEESLDEFEWIEGSDEIGFCVLFKDQE